MRLGLLFRILCVALLAFAIVGEESLAGKGSPIQFQAEVEKMLNILINSLYTNRNIFLREIISNASDALDKIRFLYLTNLKEPLNASGVAPTMDIRISVDTDARLFIMRDGGVGMTKDELAANLGSLGSSGTKRFLEKMKDSTDANFIGQFGVGFYSVFLVAEKVRVASKSDDSDKQWVWESGGDGKFFLYEDERGNTLGRGTELTVELKKDADEYLELDKIKEAIHKYSEFIHFPIFIATTKKEKAAAPAKKKAADGDAPEEEETVTDEAEAEEVVKTEWELVNENKPIWTRKPHEITDDEYFKFYKALTKDFDEPLYYSHFSAEGDVEFRSILFVPARASGNVFDTAVTHANIRLYVRRVFITDEFRDLLPRYLNFIRGVVDSDDLPLNVSREVLQESRILKLIKKKLIRKALTMIADIAASDKKLEKKKDGDDDDDDDAAADDKKDSASGNKKLKDATFPKFWEEYGKNLRLGMIEDGSNRNRLTKLLRYKTSKSDGKLVSLEDYVERMPKTQNDIFYLSAESIEKIKQSPVLEDAIKRDIEVIYMTDAIDEYVVGHVTDFSGKKLVNLAKEGVKFEDESKREKAVDAKRKEKYEPLFEWLKKLLGEHVTKIVITKRKTSEPVLMTSRAHDITARMASIIRGQALGDKSQDGQSTKRVLEINHLHPLIDELFKRVRADESDKVAEDIALVLFDTANLQNGFDIEDTLAFSRRINRILRQGVDIAVDAPLITEDLSEYDVDDSADDAADDVAAGKDGAADDDKEL